MKAYIGLGSNLGPRLFHLQTALKALKKIGSVKAGPVYETPALLPPGRQDDSWRAPFLNTAAELVISSSSQYQNPLELLKALKEIEKTMGRGAGVKWAPRTIDLDILLFGNRSINIKTGALKLAVPHPELLKRNFALAPLKDLKPSLKIPGGGQALSCFRRLKTSLPLWMQVINITPDSFSDGGEMNLKKFKKILKDLAVSPWEGHIIDLGAHSTRPGAKSVSNANEWKRLKPFIDEFFNYFPQKSFFRPRLSVDTHSALTAAKALKKGADIINDVSGLSSQEMLKVLKNSSAHYVLNHSLSVPADPKKTLEPHQDPIKEIKKWLKPKLKLFKEHNISLDRIILDPGIGFGKTPGGNLEILQRINELFTPPLRLMIGASRKSFMKIFSCHKPKHREAESIGVSLALAGRGVDILRVHNTQLHARAHQAALHSAAWHNSAWHNSAWHSAAWHNTKLT